MSNGMVCQATNNCKGTIDQGFCDTCGMEAVSAQAANQGFATGSESAKTGSHALTGRTSGSKSRRTTGTARSSTRKSLGAGLVYIPELPKSDPSAAVMKDPRVPDNKRFCGSCENPLAKIVCQGCNSSFPNGSVKVAPETSCTSCSAKGKLTLSSREKGHCSKCGAKYNFVPKLKTGDMVAGQYEVAGPIAFGGMGWIYLALDKTLNRWVVLKGLLNSDDPALHEAAVAERMFLAEVKHSIIVSIYTFVQHAGDGYIVMEYIGGKTIKGIRKDRGPLPIPEAIAYIHRILPAFSYMHKSGLVYCDFKPDNMMLEVDDLKLIDLGGVRRINQQGGDIYGTVGYSAPEVAKSGPSIASDVYTIGRTLAVLITDFKGYQSKHQFSLPSAADEPIFAQHPSLYRWLCKACHENPDMRFQSADEMGDQLIGILREEVAAEGSPRPAESVNFSSDPLGLRDISLTGVNVIDIASLPAIKRDPLDPATQFIVTNLGASDPAKQTPVFVSALEQFPDSVEARLALAKNKIQLGLYAEAEKLLAEHESADGFDWRVIWYRGMSFLAQKAFNQAATCFQTCYGEVPGELAPKLALALTNELDGKTPAAIDLYQIVARTDPSYVTAVFGLSRCLASAGKREDSVDALSRVAATHSLYAEAQKAVAKALIGRGDTSKLPGAKELAKAGDIITNLQLAGMEGLSLAYDLIDCALTLVQSKQLAADSSVVVLGHQLEETRLRLACEQVLRDMARLESDETKKIALVDRANAIRPRTMF